MRNAGRWTILMGVGSMLAWIVFQPWAIYEGGAIALVAATAAYRSRSRGWPSFRRTLGDLAFTSAGASILSVFFWSLSRPLFTSDHAFESAVMGRAFLVGPIGGSSFIIGAACRTGLW